MPSECVWEATAPTANAGADQIVGVAFVVLEVENGALAGSKPNFTLLAR